MGCGSLWQTYAAEGDLLDLNDLSAGNIPAITPAMGAALAEAAAVCLESQGHGTGVRFSVRGYREGCYTLRWQPVTPQALRSWDDPRLATEMGAEGIAVLLAKAEIGYEVLRRAWQGTGFDYWLGAASADGVQGMVGMEVSGVRRGSEGVVRARIREKLQQVGQFENQSTEAYVIVVEFGMPLAEIQQYERTE